jgi:hypothetical protein
MKAEDRLAGFVAKALADGLPPERLEAVGAPVAQGTEQLPSN